MSSASSVNTRRCGEPIASARLSLVSKAPVYESCVMPASVPAYHQILDNQTVLPIDEHTTDTHGYTEMIFGARDLLGLTFAPRIAKYDVQDYSGMQMHEDPRTVSQPPMTSGAFVERLANLDLFAGGRIPTASRPAGSQRSPRPQRWFAALSALSAASNGC